MLSGVNDSEIRKEAFVSSLIFHCGATGIAYTDKAPFYLHSHFTRCRGDTKAPELMKMLPADDGAAALH